MDLVDPASGSVPYDAGAEDPEKEPLEPTVKGTFNVIRAAKDWSCACCADVVAGGHGAESQHWHVGKFLDDCWADIELLKKLQLWYSVSETPAEKSAWDFAAKEGLQVLCSIH
ncbi:hypothetical protein BS78_06G028400 [Paspalum vaginatum]|nr:hypothetical protein BS78_06G028400 [Paspalum vaginatum]